MCSKSLTVSDPAHTVCHFTQRSSSLWLEQQWGKTHSRLIHVCSKSLKYKHFPRAPAEPCDWCSSSLPQTQSTVVLIKLCAAFHTSSPTVILGRSQCEGCCKPPHRPIAASISPHWGFQALVPLNQPHLSQRWAWVWLWNVSAVDGPHMGRKRKTPAVTVHS